MNNGHQVHFFYHDKLAHLLSENFSKVSTEELRSSRQDRSASEAISLARQDTIENFWEQDAFTEFHKECLPDLGVEVMESIQGDMGRELHINIPNHGHVVDLPEGTVVETTTRLWAERAEPLGLDPIPTHHKGLCASIAHHQRLLVDASVAGEKDQLLRALLSEPVIRSADRALPMFEELWSAAVAAGELGKR